MNRASVNYGYDEVDWTIVPCQKSVTGKIKTVICMKKVHSRRNWNFTNPEFTVVDSPIEFTLNFLVVGVPVETEAIVDHFSGHFRIPWGRKPPWTANTCWISKVQDFEKILYLCANFRSNMVFVEMYLLLDYNRYALIDVVNASSEVGSRKVYLVFILISRLSALITPN